MKAAPLLVAWHDNNDPVYSAHFEPHGKGRLATAGGDANVRLWSIEAVGDERKITYLSTLRKHNQAVNVVRWCPRGELLASAGDDGNVLLWTPSDNAAHATSFGEDGQEDVEHWRVKTMCRSNTGSEIYDIAWSPDGKYFLTGSMDNVARIFDAHSGAMIRQLAEHSHYVQGVAWDPLNEYVATQSSDRSVHIYSLKSKDGQFSLHNKVTKMDLPGRRISSHSPAPPDFGVAAAAVGTPSNHRSMLSQDVMSETVGSPKPSAPGTPQSLALPMNPPPTSHSRRSSFGSQMGHSMRRSVSPSPSLPLPAVMPYASPSLSGSMSMGVRNANLYANETFTSFFRRLTFSPDGGLLLTPAGQYKTQRPGEGGKTTDETLNTVYVYTRAGLHKPPVLSLSGHKKPSVAVRCSPILYNLRTAAASTETKEITIDTHNHDDIPPLPEPVMTSRAPTSHAAMDPPPLTSAPSPSPSATLASPLPGSENDPMSASATTAPAIPPAGPAPLFDLPYRIVYAVATQDAVLLYDSQQLKPICVVSNLHYATFTDLAWSSDGLTLLMTSSDGFCSSLTFAPGELGTVYTPPPGARHTPAPISVGRANSTSSTPQPTPTGAPAMAASNSQQGHHGLHQRKSSSQSITSAVPTPINPSSASPFHTPSYGHLTSSAGITSGIPPPRPASPARSMSTSSIATDASFARALQSTEHPALGINLSGANAASNLPTPALSTVPSLAAAGSTPTPNTTSATTPAGAGGALPLFTPPQTPGQGSGSQTQTQPQQLPSHPAPPPLSHSSVAASSTAAPKGASVVVPATRTHTAAAEAGGAAAAAGEEQQGREKRRRIAPTLVTSAASSSNEDAPAAPAQHPHLPPPPLPAGSTGSTGAAGAAAGAATPATPSSTASGDGGKSAG